MPSAGTEAMGMSFESGADGLGLGEDDPDTDYDEASIRFGMLHGEGTDFTEMYSTSSGAMTRDLDDPYAFEKKPLHYIPGYTGHLPLNRSQKFVPADQVAQEEATDEQFSHLFPHSQGPFGVYPNDTWVAKLDYVTTSSKVAPMNVPDDPTSLASRIAHRRVARTKRNLNGGLFRPDPYDDSTVDDIAALDPRLKILQSRTEYRSEASAEMQTSSEELFDMRDDGAVYSGANAMG